MDNVIAINKPGWARPVWSALLALAHQVDSSAAGTDTLWQMMQALSNVLPCAMCAEHFKAYMVSHPIQSAPTCVEYVHNVKDAVAQRENAQFRPSSKDSATHAAFMHQRLGCVVTQALFTMHTAARVDNTAAWTTVLHTAAQLVRDEPGLHDAAARYAASDPSRPIAVRDVLLHAWRSALGTPGMEHVHAKQLIAAYARDPRNAMPWQATWPDDWFLLNSADVAKHVGHSACNSSKNKRAKIVKAVLITIVATVIALLFTIVVLMVVARTRRNATRRRRRVVPTMHKSPRSYSVRTQ